MSPTHHRHLTRIDVGNEFIHHPVLEIVYRTAEQGRTYGTGALALSLPHRQYKWTQTGRGLLLVLFLQTPLPPECREEGEIGL